MQSVVATALVVGEAARGGTEWARLPFGDGRRGPPETSRQWGRTLQRRAGGGGFGGGGGCEGRPRDQEALLDAIAAFIDETQNGGGGGGSGPSAVPGTADHAAQ